MIPRIAFPDASQISAAQETESGVVFVSAPLKVDVSWLIKQLNEKLPKSWVGEDNPSIDVIKDERLKWKVK